MCASKQYHETLVLNLKKDLQIRQLKQKLNNNRFNAFNEVLSPSTIEELRLLADIPEKDSTFVLMAMKDLYREDLNHLKCKTYSGRKKEALTPEKVDVIKKMFIERVDAVEKNSKNINDRKSKFSKHVKGALQNINRTTGLETNV